MIRTPRSIRTPPPASFSGWVRAAPDARVTRSELAAVLDTAIHVAFREYDERNRVLRQLARGLGYLLGALIWPVRQVVRLAGRAYARWAPLRRVRP
jgi:hypothetical protein